MTHIIVLGAGYTGMISALGVAARTRRNNVQVTLVNPSDYFTERLRLHQVAAGQQLRSHEISALISRTRIVVKKGRATHIDAKAHTVTVEGEVLSFDRLIFAIGSVADTTLVPGAADKVYTLDDARLPSFLSSTSGTFIVCGSGLTGIEAATEIAEAYPQLQVVLVGRSEPGNMMGDKARAYLHRSLDRLGITVLRGGITKVLPDGLEVDGTFVRANGVLWTAGVRVPDLAARAGINVDTSGRIITDEYLRSVSHPAIYAVGDAAAVHQNHGILHGTCQSGMPMGAHAAANIARDLAGKTLRPFRFGYFHQPVSLGRRDAVIQFVRPGDTPRRGWLHGRIAVRYKETVSASPLTTFRLGTYFPIPAAFLTFSRG